MVKPYQINCNGKLLSLEQPKVMGILNFTSDSFYDGGKNNSISQALQHCEKMLIEGATIIDLGGQSTRPNATMLNSNDERSLLKNIIPVLTREFPDAVFSIDTFWSEVAAYAIENGFAIVNDISAGTIDQKMMETVAKLQVPYVLMHMIGTPKTMQQHTNYADILFEINLFFAEKINQLRALNVNDILLDIGFGFSKTVEQNFEVLANLECITNVQELPIVVGISRKSMIYKTLNHNAKESLNGTTALHMKALEKGAKLLRVHDVKEAKECIVLHEKLQEYAK